MFLMYKAIFLILLLVGNGEGDKKQIFTSPLEIPLTLSANFGELRPGHFHSGLDFKTNGVSGKRVLSVADGYIYRISVSPGGFGNAIYIRHNNNYSTVYGHLDRFTPALEKYVTDYQYRKKSFSVNIFPDREEFPVSQKQLIAYSGNSGGSFGPHLHFEVRNSSNENPVDPLQFFDIKDDIKPVLKQLTIYPLGDISEVNGKKDKSSYSLKGSKGIYTLNPENLIKVSGEFGIGLSSWDFLNDSWNKCGIRTLEVRVDSLLVYQHSLDEFSFSNTRYINSHIDYEEYIKSKTYIQLAFLSPNNNLRIYDTISKGGKIALTDTNTHNIKVIAGDFSGNQSEVNFTVKKLIPQNRIVQEDQEISRLMPFNQLNEFIHHDLKVSFQENSFYDTVEFSYMKIPGDSNLLGDIHFVHKPSVPVHKFYMLSIKPLISDTSILAKACIVSIKNNELTFVGGKYIDGFVTTRVREFGTYSIGIDTIPPEIHAVNFTPESRLSGRSDIRFKIKDSFSGIAHYEGFIDGEWALFEWDPKNDLLKYIFNKGNIEANSNHNLELLIKDGCGNSSTYKTTFFW